MVKTKPNQPQVKLQRQEANHDKKRKAPLPPPPPEPSSEEEEDDDQDMVQYEEDSSDSSEDMDALEDESDNDGDEDIEEEDDGDEDAGDEMKEDNDNDEELKAEEDNDSDSEPKLSSNNTNKNDSSKKNQQTQSIISSSLGSSALLHQTSSFKSDGRYHNKQRCLTICSRGATARFRHLLEDLRTLIPHHKKDSKLDAKKSGGDSTGKAVNEIAEIMGCNTALYLECRKHQDAYLWIGFTQTSSSSSFSLSSTTNTSTMGGPSAKFLVENVHTMDELRLTGNSMKGSRPVLSFDPSFDVLPHLKILKCLFIDIFSTPRGHPKSKPFVDRVMGFYYADGKVGI